MKTTKTQDQIKMIFEAAGLREDPKDRSRYLAFFLPKRKDKIFVGPHGALRIGPCASRSISLDWKGYKGVEGAIKIALKMKAR